MTQKMKCVEEEIKELSKDLTNVKIAPSKDVNHLGSLGEAINTITEMVEKYKDHEHLEMEFRLGFIEENGETKEFNTDIGEEFKEKIGKILETCKQWSVKERVVTKDYSIKGKRLSLNPKGEKKCIQKKKLCILDFRFEGTPFDIRVCFSQEIPITLTEFKKGGKNYYIRRKDRMSYKYKTWSFDVTEVKSEDNTVESISCEVELECDLPSSLTVNSSKYVVHSSLLKIRDIVNMCENIEGETSLNFLSLKEFD